MKKITTLFLIVMVLFACSSEKKKVDVLIKNATIYTVNESFETTEAFVIKDGKILDIGTLKEIEATYESDEIVDAEGGYIYPGLIDAHCHFYGLGLNQQVVNLVGTTSFDEVLERVIAFQNKKKSSFITGRGWDQNDWEIKEFPTKDKLDSLFPDTPVALRRIDGHALLVNQKALDLAGITSETKVDGGEIVLENEMLTGILIDNPMGLIQRIIPENSLNQKVSALKDAEAICFSYGLTTVNDAGLSRETVELIDSLQTSNELTMRVYAMISASNENLDYYLQKGIIKTDYLNVRSFKVYADGALGSRGAALRNPYSDKPEHFGAMVTSINDINEIANRIANESEYQMNTHAIGDSANTVILKTYLDVLKNKNDRRWKVEHAQIVSLSDFNYFSFNIIPSIQPTHATSDMYWAEDRVGAERIKGAYAYKTLLDKAGIIVLGTDFPVELVNPMHTFYAAVSRKDLQNYPEGGFRIEEALSREETLKGMTIWAAFSNFEEAEKGSLEIGKFADFIILPKDIMTIPENEIPSVKVKATYIAGKKVY